MNYIVLDMEWNQPGFTDKVQFRGGVCMKNEIVQMGAVKLDENQNIVGHFEVVIKPECFKTMNKVIEKLTGITNETLETGKPFKEAIEEFLSWCGDDFVFLIWGYDDIRILKNNMMFHGVDTSGIPKHYNIQVIFCHQKEQEKRQYSLSYALEFCKIDVNEQLHDAYNDAMYTALVCKNLDIKKGIEDFAKYPSGTKEQDENNPNMLIKRKFRYLRKKEEIWSNGYISRPACPICCEKMKYEKHKAISQNRYHIKAKCEKDGEFMIVIRSSLVPANNTYSVCQQIFVYNDDTKQMFEKKARVHRNKRHPRKNSGDQMVQTKTEDQ